MADAPQGATLHEKILYGEVQLNGGAPGPAPALEESHAPQLLAQPPLFTVLLVMACVIALMW
jgi:hypothetical protein